MNKPISYQNQKLSSLLSKTPLFLILEQTVPIISQLTQFIHLNPGIPIPSHQASTNHRFLHLKQTSRTQQINTSEAHPNSIQNTTPHRPSPCLLLFSRTSATTPREVANFLNRKMSTRSCQCLNHPFGTGNSHLPLSRDAYLYCSYNTVAEGIRMNVTSSCA